MTDNKEDTLIDLTAAYNNIEYIEINGVTYENKSFKRED